MKRILFVAVQERACRCSEEMEQKKRFASPVVLMTLLAFSSMISPALASCSSGGNGNKGSGGTNPSK